MDCLRIFCYNCYLETKMTPDQNIFLNEESSFRQLFDAYFDRVFDFIAALSKSDYIAEETTQELFVILWRKRNDLHEVRNMDQYVFRIARNLAINLLKKAATDSKLATQFYDGTIQHTSEVLEKISHKEVQSLIDQAVAALPAQPRKVYLMSRHEHMNYDEIAIATNLSRNTVKNHLQKALQEIRKYLIDHNYQPVIALILVEYFR
jgi:RNA polymerase sigma-70 factor (family 1)